MPTPTKGQEKLAQAVQAAMQDPKGFFAALGNTVEGVLKRKPTETQPWCGTPKEEKEQPSCWEPKGRK